MRRAGSGRLPDGARVTWTLAAGTRGRRWRSVTTAADGGFVLGLLVEVAPGGALVKLEAASPAGLLTLHPDGGTLHGNVVRASGIEHVTLPFPAGGVVLVDRSPVAAAVAAAVAGGRVAVGEGSAIGGAAVDGSLSVRAASWLVTRAGERAWRLEPDDGGAAVTVVVDSDGIPVLEGSAAWALEEGVDGGG